jgi:hypothetical protein
MAFIHHTVDANGYGPGQVPAMLRAIQAYHQDAQGWGDIGYNFVIDRFGRVWEGRDGGLDRPVIGAHTQGFNTGSVGIAVLGSFSSTLPSDAALTATAQVAGWKLGVAGVSPTATTTMVSGGNDRYPAGRVVTFNTVSGHLDAKPTSCPGAHLYARLPIIRTRASAVAAVVRASPFGHVDIWRQTPSGFRLRGWAADRTEPTTPLNLHLYIDGVAEPLGASDDRPDVAAAFPELGAAHGFDITRSLPEGDHRICLYAINRGVGRNTQLGCGTVPIYASPVGEIESARVEPDGAHIGGWALDFDTADPIALHVYVDGVPYAVVASTIRPDLAERLPEYGPDHGFDFVVPAPSRSLCVYAIDVGAGTNRLIGCPRLDSDPLGRLDAIGRAPGGIRLVGWVIDPNASGATHVHTYVDGVGFASPASGPRPDIGRLYPVWGPDHGFDVTVPGRTGANRVCAYGLNVGIGHSRLLGCRTVLVTHNPYGSFDVVFRAGGQRRAAGWAIDPDTGAALVVHLYAGGRVVAASANRGRPDVGARYPFYGPAHGFDTPVPEGGQVCAYAVNVGPGTNVLLGCRA